MTQRSQSSLSLRQLNRATLERQHLLERTTMPARELIAHLVGLQAQEQRDPSGSHDLSLEPLDD